MDDKNFFELPKPSEKLAFKFILDSFRELKEEGETPPEAPLTETVSQLELCGTEAPANDTLEPEFPLPMAEETHDEPLAAGSVLIPTSIPNEKKYFRIGEVSTLVGVEPYVLRYWEKEFRLIKPLKSSSGHRVYHRKDVELLQVVRHLLHVEKFSIQGAKKKLQERRQEVVDSKSHEDVAKTMEFLKSLNQDVKELIRLVRSNPGIG